MARSTILAGLALVAAGCGSRSDLSLPSTTTEACAGEAMAARPCTSLHFGVAPTPIDLTFDSKLAPGLSSSQLIDRGDHVDLITATTVTSIAASSTSLAVMRPPWQAPDLCGQVGASGALFASTCQTPFTVFRVYDGSYTRIAERELVTASFGGPAPIGGPSSWLVSWFNSAAIFGPDTQPIVGPIDEIATFVDTPCGFVGVTQAGNSSTTLTYGADFDAPSGASVPFDTIGSQCCIALDGLARWPYDGESIAAVIGSGVFSEVAPNRLEVVSRSGAHPYDVTGAWPIATPLGLVLIETGQGFVGPISLRIINPDGSAGASLAVATPTTPTSGLTGLNVVWSNGVLVVLWAEYDASASHAFAATVRCDD
ncbi:MAG TPA: hypothetical protein VLM85_15615 [Polyangiaceae bacterium]|nr:hypothetical protein [Polyangiaceae bacterium]